MIHSIRARHSVVGVPFQVPHHEVFVVVFFQGASRESTIIIESASGELRLLVLDASCGCQLYQFLVDSFVFRYSYRPSLCELLGTRSSRVSGNHGEFRSCEESSICCGLQWAGRVYGYSGYSPKFSWRVEGLGGPSSTASSLSPWFLWICTPCVPFFDAQSDQNMRDDLIRRTRGPNDGTTRCSSELS
jgi:hypothetical protein